MRFGVGAGDRTPVSHVRGEGFSLSCVLSLCSVVLSRETPFLGVTDKAVNKVEWTHLFPLLWTQGYYAAQQNELRSGNECGARHSEGRNHAPFFPMERT